jgi:hypothetical protein
MKRLVNKFRKKKMPTVAERSSSTRITNETVAEHRERILAGGRKFKYPLQTPKHRIVVITIMLVVFTVAAFFGGFTWTLYVAQNTSQFTQRLTQVLPYPVAVVDGQQVRFSDYLLELRSSMHYLSTKESINFSSEDGKRQLEYQKRLALNKAVNSAYAVKLANQQKVTVSSQEVDAFVKKEIDNSQLGVSEQVFKQVIQDYYGWSFDEYKSSVSHQLLRKKVMAKIDADGRTRANAALAEVTTGGKNFSEVAKAVSDDPTAKTSGGDVGFVPRSTDDPNGLVSAASAMQPGQVSQVIEGNDGFYIVKLFEVKYNTIRFSKIFFSYKTFNQQLAALKKNGKIQEYIKVAETVSSSNQ